MSRAGVNQKHEADVCLHPQGGLAVSRLPWQAGFGCCQNLELWHDSVTLLVRPSLPPAFLLSKSESQPLMASLATSPLSPEDRMAGGVSVAASRVGEKPHRALFLEHCQCSSPPRCQETQALETVAAGSIPRLWVRCSDGGGMWPNRRAGLTQADKEVTSPDFSNIPFQAEKVWN